MSRMKKWLTIFYFVLIVYFYYYLYSNTRHSLPGPSGIHLRRSDGAKLTQSDDYKPPVPPHRNVGVTANIIKTNVKQDTRI